MRPSRRGDDGERRLARPFPHEVVAPLGVDRRVKTQPAQRRPSPSVERVAGEPEDDVVERLPVAAHHAIDRDERQHAAGRPSSAIRMRFALPGSMLAQVRAWRPSARMRSSSSRRFTRALCGLHGAGSTGKVSPCAWPCSCLLTACGGPADRRAPHADVAKFLPATLEADAAARRATRAPVARPRLRRRRACARCRTGRKTSPTRSTTRASCCTPLLGVQLADRLDQGLGSHRRPARRAARRWSTLDEGDDVDVGDRLRHAGRHREHGDEPSSATRSRSATTSSCARGPRSPRPTRSARRLPDAQGRRAHRGDRRAPPPQADRRAAPHARDHARRDRRGRPDVDPAPAVLAEAEHVLRSQPRSDAARDRRPARRRHRSDARARSCSRRSRRPTGAAGSPTDHDEVVATLRNVVDAAKAGKTAADVPPAAYEQFNRDPRARQARRRRAALIELDNLLTAYPGNATMHELEVRDHARASPASPTRRRAPRARASRELAPGDPTRAPRGRRGAASRAKDIAGARAELVKAEDKIAQPDDRRRPRRGSS